MKLIILYGPPAVGKLTIAQELASIAEIKVFDNHQVIDIVEPLTTRQYTGFADIIYSTQRSILDAAVSAAQVNIVITFPYAANLPRDVAFLTALTNDFRERGVEVYPVFLTCDTKTLLDRALEPSRKAYGKITTTDIMTKMIEKYDFDTPLDIPGNVSFNTGKLPPIKVAKAIKKLTGL